jgi:hypothetical protein
VKAVGNYVIALGGSFSFAQTLPTISCGNDRISRILDDNASCKERFARGQAQAGQDNLPRRRADFSARQCQPNP